MSKYKIEKSVIIGAGLDGQPTTIYKFKFNPPVNKSSNQSIEFSYNYKFDADGSLIDMDIENLKTVIVRGKKRRNG